MKTNPESDMTDELRPEYTAADLKNRVRGKYADRFSPATHLVALEPDVAAVFPDAATVNAALRFLIKTTKENQLVTTVER